MPIVKGYAGARIRLEALAHTTPLIKKLRAVAKKTPTRGREALTKSVALWHADSIRHMPVRASRRARPTRKAPARGRLYRRVGRGTLKKQTRAYVKGTRTTLRGGIYSGVHYAIWLAAGTRFIAKGRVMRWQHGQPPIRQWPAKALGGNPRAQLPIVLPYQVNARKRMLKFLKRGSWW
jgi:hypothetical protein